MREIYSLKLADILPSSIALDPRVASAAEALDIELQSVSQSIRETLIFSRIGELPEPILDLLAWQWHVDSYAPQKFSIEQKRNAVKNAIILHRKKGTLWAVKQNVLNLGFPKVKIDEWFKVGGLPYTFAVEVPLQETLMRGAEHAITEYKSVRSLLLWLAGRINFAEECQLPLEHWFAIPQTAITENYVWPEVFADSITVGAKCTFAEHIFAEHIYGEKDLFYTGDGIEYEAMMDFSELWDVANVRIERKVNYDGEVMYGYYYGGREVFYT
jgi:phage tail P2-like protein